MLASPPRFNFEPASPPSAPTSTSTSTSTPTSQRQWLHLQPQGGSVSDIQKKRRILQPHSHNQYHQHQLRPHSGSPALQTSTQSNASNTGHHHYHNNTRKAPPPALMIPFFDNQRDPGFSSIPSPDEYDAVSPRTTTISTRDASALPVPVLRPCHVCHRKPSTKVMLDAYADCELCGQRACYICLRECNSLNCVGSSLAIPTSSTPISTPDECDDMMHCTDIRREDGYLHTRPHSRMRDNEDGKDSSISPRIRQRKICSCCAVEGLTDTGQEIVWCLDCVRREEVNHQQPFP